MAEGRQFLRRAAALPNLGFIILDTGVSKSSV